MFRNSCLRLQLLDFSLDSIMSLPRFTFNVVSALHHCLLFCLFLADQIFYRYCVHRQHFRLRSFASSCFTVYYLEYGRHVARLRRRRHRAYALKSNAAGHDNHEKINLWVSFSFLYEYGVRLAEGPPELR